VGSADCISCDLCHHSTQEILRAPLLLDITSPSFAASKGDDIPAFHGRGIGRLLSPKSQHQPHSRSLHRPGCDCHTLSQQTPLHPLQPHCPCGRNLRKTGNDRRKDGSCSVYNHRIQFQQKPPPQTICRGSRENPHPPPLDRTLLLFTTPSITSHTSLPDSIRGAPGRK